MPSFKDPRAKALDDFIRNIGSSFVDAGDWVTELPGRYLDYARAQPRSMGDKAMDDIATRGSGEEEIYGSLLKAMGMGASPAMAESMPESDPVMPPEMDRAMALSRRDKAQENKASQVLRQLMSASSEGTQSFSARGDSVKGGVPESQGTYSKQPRGTSDNWRRNMGGFSSDELKSDPAGIAERMSTSNPAMAKAIMEFILEGEKARAPSGRSFDPRQEILKGLGKGMGEGTVLVREALQTQLLLAGYPKEAILEILSIFPESKRR